MSYSRRQLYALGEPLGDCVTRLKPGGRVYGGGDSGGGGQPANTTNVQTAELPEWAKPYAKDTLAKGAALTDINKNPYQQYGGQRIAGFQPLQEQAFKTVGGMDAGPAGFQAGIGQYMSPYMQNVVDIQKREAGRQSDILGTQQQAQATQAGAFGGGRDAIVRAERERNLSQQMGDIQARGSQAAYDQAANQFRQGITQQSGLAQMQGQMGAQQQQQAQRPLDVAYQDFLNQQNYPYKQLGFMSDMIRGLPLGQRSTSQVYEGPGNTMGQLAGLGMGAYGLSKMFAEGGLAGGSMIDENEPVIRYADGGSVTDVNNVESILGKLSDQQLQQAHEAALNRRDVEQAQMIEAEISKRAAVRQPGTQDFGGIAPAISDEFADGMEQAMASGGIVAFADRGAVKEMPEKATSPVGDILDALGVTGGLNALRESYYKNKEFEKRTDAAESMYPGLTEALRPSERARRKAAGDVLFTGPQDVKPMTPEEIEAANAKITGKSGKPPTTSTAGAGRGTYPGYVPQEDIKTSAKPAKAAPTAEDIFAGPKPSKKEVKSAVAQFAEQNNIGSDQKEDLMTTALKIREELGKQNQPILDRLNAAIEAQKPDEQALKDRGFAQALTQFGFGMAERASKPGARFLESAAGAAPVIGTVAAETNKLIDAKKDNYVKLQLDQAKYEVALAKGDMQTAATLAAQIRQGQQQDKALQFQIAKAQDDLAIERQKLAQQGAYQQGILSRQPETLQGLAAALEKATPEQRKFLEQAASIRYGTAAGIGAVEKNKAAFISGMKEIDANYPPLLASRDPKTAAMREQAIRELRALTNMTGIEGSGNKVLRFNERGELIQ